MSTTHTKTLSLRFPAPLHQAAADAAARSQVSLNQLVQHAIEQYLQQLEDQELFESFSRLGEDLEECSVDFAWDAQREAIDRAAV